MPEKNLRRGSMCARVVLSKDDSSAKWNKIFVAGEFHRADFPGGKLVVGRDEFEQMIQNWKRAGGNALPVDRFHWGESSDTSVSADDKDAVGFIEDLRIDADGDLEGLIAWNELGREKILGDKLRYFSPTFTPKGVDQRNGSPQGFTLFGGALLNDPYLTELPRMAATNSPSKTTNEGASPKEQHMDKKLICALLGIADTSTDNEVQEHLKKCATAYASASKMNADLEGLRTDFSKRGDALRLAEDKAISLAKENEQLKKAQSAIELSQLQDELVKDRRINAAQRGDVAAYVEAQGVAKAREFFSKMPQQGFGEGEKGHSQGGDGGTTDKVKLQAEFEAELDKLTAKGVSVSLASRQVRADPKFKPLFTN